MPPVGFEPMISAGERPQTYALDRAAAGTDMNIVVMVKIKYWNIQNIFIKLWACVQYWVASNPLYSFLLALRLSVSLLKKTFPEWRNNRSPVRPARVGIEFDVQVTVHRDKFL